MADAMFLPIFVQVVVLYIKHYDC